MRIVQGVMVALLVLTVCPVAASAQDDKCPKGLSNDECDQWHFERMDRLLSEAVASRIDASSKMTTRQDIIAAIKQTGQEAHRAWVAFREAECTAYVAANVMSARTERGKKASCLLSMTQRRIAEVKKP
ncbi:MAG: hypothetical protein JWN71_108 [Xanthobacteraceae bacterium]|nr:hypothetical protein [Xanthobacteraceae bacterium]